MESSTVSARVAQSAEAQKRRCTKILVVDENLDPQHTLFFAKLSLSRITHLNCLKVFHLTLLSEIFV